ncbi:ubiquitin- hect domain protein, putative [Ichthyophthirius multifiliis]|uniref:Ubiquitin-hect domain protein, putative n=1 Tax=Ichthyophthirius multifiliis TaxID=5932 RepID=G0QSD1_ICHMU|nr:ubiquitin- hect domain protein, putative [Ichthyophthirius multifiliis]EGR31878.1 ubiquitin- hect domain protein, putative [Ichthyophthirius multifiliis]|eukprot:XP_004035364.1 ubiquitin- hect domain protein, putative [Ichthyophthirius multifiliis]
MVYDDFNEFIISEGEEEAFNWFEEQKQKIHQKLIQNVRQVLIQEDQSVISFMYDLIKLIINTLQFTFSPNMTNYSLFKYSMKSILRLYKFLHEEDYNQKLNIPETENNEEENYQNNQLKTQFSHEQIELENNNITVHKLTYNLLNIKGQKLKIELNTIFDILIQNTRSLIQIFLDQNESNSKKSWLDLLNILQLNINQSYQVYAQNKFNQIMQKTNKKQNQFQI